MKIKFVLDRLLEDFEIGVKSSIRGKEEYREIFKNPSKSEVKSIEEFSGKFGNVSVRFIADKNRKEVFVSAGDVFHDDMAAYLDYYSMDYFLKTFPGVGNIKRGVVVVESLGEIVIGNNMMNDILEDIENGEYDWMEKYNFDLNKIKNKY